MSLSWGFRHTAVFIYHQYLNLLTQLQTTVRGWGFSGESVVTGKCCFCRARVNGLRILDFVGKKYSSELCDTAAWQL